MSCGGSSERTGRGGEGNTNDPLIRIGHDEDIVVREDPKRVFIDGATTSRHGRRRVIDQRSIGNMNALLASGGE